MTAAASAIVPAPGARVDLWMQLPNVGRIEKVLGSILALPGVESVEHLLPVSQWFVTEWLDEAIQARTEGATPETRSG